MSDMNVLRFMSRSAAPRQRQSGVATLVVVLVLFFVVSMVAAYTNRNLIFEQRTSSNQYRSTQALEAAEAGLEWTTAALNMGRVDDTCQATTNTAHAPLRERLLSIDATGRIRPRLGPSGEELSAVCVFNGSGWTCSCPTSGTANVTPPTADGIWPAFRVRFVKVAGTPSATTTPRQPGVVRAEVVGCTRADDGVSDACLQFGSGLGAASEGRAVVSSLLAITGSASSPPQAALVARQRVQIGGAGISAYNNIAGGSGVTIQSGGDISGTALLVGQPGSPGGAATLIRDDSALSLPDISGSSPITSADRMFASVFNLRPETFRKQPATLQVDCGSTDCSAAAVRAVASANPWRPLWLTGGLSMDSAGELGSPERPVVLVVNGGLTFSNSAAKIVGLVYVRTPSGSDAWSTSGAGTIMGAAVADKKVEGDSTSTFVFDPGVIGRIRWQTGSFVRVPGSWKDFE